MSAHKLHSPSSAARRRLCPGSLAACQGEPNENSVYAAEGTAYHFVAGSVLEKIKENGGVGLQGTECADWVGMYVHVTPETCYAGLPDKRPGDEFVFKITEEDATYAQVYVDAMLARNKGSTLQFYEVEVDTSRVIGIPGQGGTGDCVTLDFDTLTIFSDDLKFGKGKAVSAFWIDKGDVKRPNDQGAEYGAGVLDMYRMLAPWKRVVVGIHQPRIQGDRYTEIEMSVEELDAWSREICAPYEQKAHALLTASPEEIMANLKPSKEGCKFCPLDGRCKAQITEALAAYPAINVPDGLNKAKSAIWVATDEEFERVLELAERYSEFWGSVWGEGMRRAESRGGSFGDWMIAMGKKGHRALNPDAMLPPLTDESGAEILPATKVSELLVAELGDDAYAPQEFKTASKLDDLLNKKGRSAEQKSQAAARQALWRRLVPAITQPDGKPQLVRKAMGRAPMPRVSGADEFAPINVPNLL